MSNRNLQLATDLAAKICNCPHVALAIDDKKHPCHKVVNEQKLSADHSDRQRPEPWFGNLAEAKVLFISSNPSINDEAGDLAEDFPTYEWPVNKSADFFVNRVTGTAGSPASFGFADEPDFLTRTKSGEYRNGGKSPKTPQKTWNLINDRAKELLGNQASPVSNYALTEVVHCKSRVERGVPQASSHCANSWLPSILNLTPAKIVVLLGAPVRDNFAEPVLKAAMEFGRDKNKEYENLTQAQRVHRDTFVSDFGGTKRIYLFNWHPTSYVKFDMKILKKVYGDFAIKNLSLMISGELEFPEDTKSLHAMPIERN